MLPFPEVLPFSLVMCWSCWFMPCVNFINFEFCMLTYYIVSQQYEILLCLFVAPRTCSEVAGGSITRGITFLRHFPSTVDWSFQLLSECCWEKDNAAGLSSTCIFYYTGVFTPLLIAYAAFEQMEHHFTWKDEIQFSIMYLSFLQSTTLWKKWQESENTDLLISAVGKQYFLMLPLVAHKDGYA